MRVRVSAFLVVWLLGVLCALIACSRGPSEAPVSFEEFADSSEPAAVVLSPRDQTLGANTVFKGDLDAMIERRLVRALVTYSPTYYFLDGPRQRGLSYDALKLFETHLNESLNRRTLKVLVVPIPVDRDELLPLLEQGYGDLAVAGLTITEDRQQQVAFSDPLMRNVKEVIVSGPNSPEIETLDDLAGQEIYVRRSSSYFESLAALNERFQSAGKRSIEFRLAEEDLEDEDLMEMVDAGMAPLIVVDEHKASFWAGIFDNLTVHSDVAVREGGQIAWAFRKDSPKLAKTVNAFVAKNKRGTLTGNVLFRRYLSRKRSLENALDELGQERLHRTQPLFEKHAPAYDFDPLLMMAQGYQESRLDQSAVSPRGAVGIMQLLPSTAADESVGIEDISSADSNILAGVRYMGWIRDTYFDDPSINTLNQTLFTLAGYNGGPNRIRRLRSEAEKRGLNPNVWFRNVEVLAAEQIGRETVDYVSNIYKYYAAYRLLQMRAQ